MHMYAAKWWVTIRHLRAIKAFYSVNLRDGSFQPHNTGVVSANSIHYGSWFPLFHESFSFFWTESHRYCSRVQDPYSLRCCPQVHGIVWDTIEFVRGILTTELNSSTDNPVSFNYNGNACEYCVGNFRLLSTFNLISSPLIARLPWEETCSFGRKFPWWISSKGIGLPSDCCTRTG